MHIVKKLFFAPFFLFSIVLLLIFANQLITDPVSIIFSFGTENAWAIFYLVAALLFSGFFFQVFAMLSSDIKLGLPVIVLASLIPLGLFADMNIALTLSSGFFICLLISYFAQQQKMIHYLTFSPLQLLQPTIKLAGLLVIITLSIGFYFAAEKKISTEGFSLPEPLIEAAVSMSGASEQMTEDASTPEPASTLPQLSPQLVQQLKANPALLRQYGVTPSQLDALAQAQQKTASNGESNGDSSVVSTLVKSQVDKMIEPYKAWIPGLLSLLFFVTLTSLTSFFSLLLSPLILLLFWILEKTNFVQFETEMREVKKLIV